MTEAPDSTQPVREERPLSTVRDWREILDDESGQLVTEWMLVTVLVVIPFGLLGSSMLGMLRYYYYRITGVVTLPFP